MKLLEVSSVIEQLGIDRTSFQEWIRSLSASDAPPISVSTWMPWQQSLDKPAATEKVNAQRCTDSAMQHEYEPTKAIR
jgi:hypothetical protein